MRKRRIYVFRSEGTYLPEYFYCKVYNDGTMIAGEGRLWPPEERNKDIHHATRKFSKDDIRKIERIIDRNYRVLSLKQNDLEEIMPVYDGTYETFIISDGEKEVSFEIPDAFLGQDAAAYENYDPEKTSTPNIDLILHIHAQIRKILIKNGLNPEYI